MIVHIVVYRNPQLLPMYCIASPNDTYLTVLHIQFIFRHIFHGINNMFFCIFRYNVTTGQYPFEGENVYKLFEKIGKGVFTIPDELDDSLKDLIGGRIHYQNIDLYLLYNDIMCIHI